MPSGEQYGKPVLEKILDSIGSIML